ncbi:MAG: epimerase [Akkermansiaceae bacterium]
MMMNEKRRMMIAGANGFIGSYLSRYFLERGWTVLGLARRADGLADGVEFVEWDGETLEGEWAGRLDGTEVLINLVGKSVNCRMTDENKRLLISSRVNSTAVLGEAVAACDSPPSVWMNASIASIYVATREEYQTESGGEIGDSFNAEVGKKWEAAFYGADVSASVRRIALRTSLAMGEEEGTVLMILRNLAKRYLGGKMGDGGQMVSWIDVNDYCRAVEWMIGNESASGPYNMAAPNAMTNEEMMRRVREQVGVSFGLPAYEWMLKIGSVLMGANTGLILDSMWAYPEKLLEEGFVFEREEF